LDWMKFLHRRVVRPCCEVRTVYGFGPAGWGFMACGAIASGQSW
jgi:hypothetical protein